MVLMFDSIYCNSGNFCITFFACSTFFVIYYSRFQEAIIIRCSKNSLQWDFRVFNFCGFLQPRIVNNRKNLQNYGIARWSVHWNQNEVKSLGLWAFITTSDACRTWQWFHGTHLATPTVLATQQHIRLSLINAREQFLYAKFSIMARPLQCPHGVLRHRIWLDGKCTLYGYLGIEKWPTSKQAQCKNNIKNSTDRLPVWYNNRKSTIHFI